MTAGLVSSVVVSAGLVSSTLGSVASVEDILAMEDGIDWIREAVC